MYLDFRGVRPGLGCGCGKGTTCLLPLPLHVAVLLHGTAHHTHLTTLVPLHGTALFLLCHGTALLLCESTIFVMRVEVGGHLAGGWSFALGPCHGRGGGFGGGGVGDGLGRSGGGEVDGSR